MTRNILKYGALSVILLAPVGAQAQGVVGGAAKGADQGAAAAGPVGAVVGGAVGAVAGVLGVDQRPRFHDYVVREHRPSYHYDEDLRVGVVLPPEGVQYYDVPPDYGVRGEDYTVIDGHTVLVDPRTRQVIEILD